MKHGHEQECETSGIVVIVLIKRIFSIVAYSKAWPFRQKTTSALKKTTTETTGCVYGYPGSVLSSLSYVRFCWKRHEGRRGRVYQYNVYRLLGLSVVTCLLLS